MVRAGAPRRHDHRNAMDALNQTLFLWLNAPGHPDGLTLSIALFLAKGMVGAIFVAIASTWLSLRMARWYLPLALHVATRVHRKIFSPLIAHGWVKP